MNPFSILAADIGGTFSRFALFSVAFPGNGRPQLKLRREFWFSTGDFNSFEELLHKVKSLPAGDAVLEPGVTHAAIAPPGAVAGMVCHPPNIPWSIDARSVTAELGIPNVCLLNDFVAQGYGCLYARDIEENLLNMRLIQKGNPVPGAPLAIVGAGSGFGKALIFEKDMRVAPSEGGHAAFPFVGRGEFALAGFMAELLRRDEIEIEEVLGGRGFAALFSFHCGEYLDPREAVQRVTGRERDAPEWRMASDLTLEWYARLYGRACKDYVLNTLARGGLIVTGGMASRVPVLDHPAFLENLRAGASQAELLRNLPVWHVQSQQAGLWGAAFYGAMKTAF